MTGQDADIIIKLRDENKMSWENIAIETGYGVHSIKSTYEARKAGKVYLDEAVKHLKDNYDLNEITIADSLKIIHEFGVKIGKQLWQQTVTNQRIPLKGTHLWRSNLKAKLIERVKNGEDFDTAYNDIFGKYYAPTSLHKTRVEAKSYFNLFREMYQ